MVAVRVDLIARAADVLAETDDDPTAVRVLAAARGVFTEVGLRAATMDDVAARAGLGRATVYRKFSTKDALVEAVLLAEMRAYLQRLHAVTGPDVGDVAAQVVEGFVTTLQFMREESLLSAVVDLDGDWGLAYFTRLSGPVIAAARQYLAGRVREAQQDGHVDADVDPDQAAEVLVRLCHSLQLAPDGVIPYHDHDAAREFARSVLVPMVVR